MVFYTTFFSELESEKSYLDTLGGWQKVCLSVKHEIKLLYDQRKLV